MANTLTPPSDTHPPGTYIGEEYDQGEADEQCRSSYLPYVGRGSRLICTTNTALVRGYVHSAPVSFSNNCSAHSCPHLSEAVTRRLLRWSMEMVLRSVVIFGTMPLTMQVSSLADSKRMMRRRHTISYQSGDSNDCRPNCVERYPCN